MGSPAIGSSKELQTSQILKEGPNSFQNTLKKFLQAQPNTSLDENSTSQKPSAGCHPVKPFNCNSDKAVKESRENIQKAIKSTIQNITNADTPGYRRILPYLDSNGNPIIDETPGKLEKTDWHLDLAIAGDGKGFKLANGQYTRDGRFKFDNKGRMVTVDKEIPLEVCYKDGAPVDWSMKELNIDFNGKVTDKLNGKELGYLEVNLKPKGKVMQHYVEQSNVNLPIEFMGLSQKNNLLTLTNNLFTTGIRLNNEAVQILLRNL